MCAHGVTPELVEEEIVRRVGLGAGASLFGGLDKDALATIGIDLDAVRARIEASFGPQALARAAQATHRDRAQAPGAEGATAGAPVAPQAPGPAGRAGRARADSPAARGDRPLLRARAARRSGHIPFTPASKKILELTLREAVALHDSHIGVEHITLALTSIKVGLVPDILAAAGATAPALRAAILDRYRRAS